MTRRLALSPASPKFNCTHLLLDTWTFFLTGHFGSCEQRYSEGSARLREKAISYQEDGSMEKGKGCRGWFHIKCYSKHAAASKKDEAVSNAKGAGVSGQSGEECEDTRRSLDGLIRPMRVTCKMAKSHCLAPSFSNCLGTRHRPI